MGGNMTPDERKETGELYEAVMRLCAAADHKYAVLSALAFAIADYAELVGQNNCCVLSHMFRLYTTGENADMEPDRLLGGLIEHLVERGQIKAERL
jgi:hypothetical protein